MTKEKESTHYETMAYCDNCGFGESDINSKDEEPITLVIPKGVKFDHYALSHVYEQCGCTGTFKKI